MIKKCAFRRFKFGCDFSKEEFALKNNSYNNFYCRILYTKCGIISLKNFLLNKKIIKEQNKINNSKIKLLNIKNNFNLLINELKKGIKIKKINYKYIKYILNQNYIIFFKSLAISMQKRASYKQKNIQAKKIFFFIEKKYKNKKRN